MKIYIKKYLLQEGILGDHWGKIAAAGFGIAAAHSGALGPEAQKNVDQGGSNLKGFLDKMGDKSKQMTDFYKNDISSGKEHITTGIDHAKQFGSSITDKAREVSHNITDKVSNNNNYSTSDISTKVSETPVKNFDNHNKHIDQEQFNNTASELSKHFGA